MRHLIAALFALSVSVSAAAQTAAAPPSTADARREQAERLLAAGNASDLFEVVEDERISVRHTASGLTCHFFGNETQAQVMVFSNAPRGDDVGCARETTEQAATLYATRYAPPITAEEGLQAAVTGIRNRFPDARAVATSLTMSSEGLPTPHAQHFLIAVRDEQWLTSAIVAQRGDWTIKLRYSARAPDDDAVTRAQLEANAVFMLALLEIAG